MFKNEPENLLDVEKSNFLVFGSTGCFCNTTVGHCHHSIGSEEEMTVSLCFKFGSRFHRLKILPERHCRMLPCSSFVLISKVFSIFLSWNFCWHCRSAYINGRSH